MKRRTTRLRREYLYSKSLEGDEKVKFEKKRRMREALAEGKPVPTELREDADALNEEIALEDEATQHGDKAQDNEYRLAGVEAPKIVITTSRHPSSRLQQFAKELCLVFPNAARTNRGKHVVSELVAAARANAVTDIIVVHEHRGKPDGMLVSHMPFGPTAYFGLSNVVLRHDLPEMRESTVPQAYPHLVMHNLTTPLGARLATVLKHLFPVPKAESKRTISFINQNDYISFRHHSHTRGGEGARYDDVTLTELGPRFEMKLFQLRLGTMDQKHADVEYALRPYMNSAKNRTALHVPRTEEIEEQLAAGAGGGDDDDDGGAQ